MTERDLELSFVKNIPLIKSYTNMEGHFLSQHFKGERSKRKSKESEKKFSKDV